MFFADQLILDAPRRTSDGYLVVRAKASRTGVYSYTGAEIDPTNAHGLRDQQSVNVLRDEATVFDKKAVHSFIGKPITLDHPHEAVTADNWKDHASGVVMGALKDGEHLAFDLLLTDKAAIAAVDGGKRELSNGYAAELEFGDFEAADGTPCPVRQTSIRGNHVAIVDRGRAGSECSITDAARCSSLPADVFELLTDERTYSGENLDGKTAPARRETSNPGGGLRPTQDGDNTVATKTILIDGYQFEADAALEVAVSKLQGQLKDAVDARAKADTDVATLTTDKAALEAKVTTLEQQVKDAKLSPQQLRDAAKSYAQVVGKAKSLGVEVKDDQDEPAIMKAVVTAKLGDACKDWSEDQFAASFASLTKDAKAEMIDALRGAISGGVRTNANDSGASVRDLARAAQF